MKNNDGIMMELGTDGEYRPARSHKTRKRSYNIDGHDIIAKDRVVAARKNRILSRS